MIKSFVRRFWLSIVTCLIIVIVGFVSFFSLEFSLESKSEDITLSIEIQSTSSVTADSLNKICNKLEKKIKSINQVSFYESSTDSHQSNINVYFKSGSLLSDCLNSVHEAIGQIKYPTFVKYPIVHMSSKQDLPVIKIYANSKIHSLEYLTEYTKNILSGQLERIDGVSYVEVFGEKKPEIVIEFVPELCAYYNITAQQMQSILENYTSENNMMQRQTGINQFSVLNPGSLKTVEDVENVLIRDEIKIKHIAKVSLQRPDLIRKTWVNSNTSSLYIGIFKTTNGNPIQISNKALKILKEWEKSFQLNMTIEDNSQCIRELINNVIKTIFEAIILIILIVLLFLGSAKASITPILAIPISIIGTFLPMKLFGCPINVSTLMAIVIAIGLVVDDAILVVENTINHFKGDWKQASIDGTEEITVPIIVMTMTLGCVFIPVVFMKGKLGAILKDFAITLSSCVFISGIVSLTLTPMVCGRIMGHSAFIERMFGYVERGYAFSLRQVLRLPWLFAGFGILTCGSSYFILNNVAKEGSPSMDTNVFDISTLNMRNKNMDYLEKKANIITNVLKKHKKVKQFSISMNNNINIEITTNENENIDKIQYEIIKELNNVLPELTFHGKTKQAGNIFSVYLYGQIDRDQLERFGRSMVDDLNKIKGVKSVVIIANKSNSYDLCIDYNLAAKLGIDPRELREAIDSLNHRWKLASVESDGKNFKIIGLTDKYKSSNEVLEYVWSKPRRNQENLEIQPSKFTKLQLLNKYSSICNFMGLPAFQWEIVCDSKGKMSEIIEGINNVKNKHMGTKLDVGFTGSARDFLEDQNETAKIIVLSFIFIFLILLAQFESITKTLVIISTVPLACWGALLIVLLRGKINNYGYLGIITLTGLIVKHGILFINSLKPDIEDKSENAIQAASSRLRPVLMTTLAMAFGVLPLLLSKQSSMIYLREISYILFPGILIGTCMTLYIIPCIYYYIVPKELPNKTNDIVVLL